MPSGFGKALGFGLSFYLLDEFSKPAQKIKGSMGSLESTTASSTKQMGASLDGLSSKFSAVFGASVAMAVNQASILSDQLIDVSKGTGLSTEGVDDLRKGLEQLDTRTDLSSLLGIADMAGQSGVAKDRLLELTEVADKAALVLGGGFAANATEATKNLFNLKKIFQDTKNADPAQTLNSIASALNEVGKGGATNVKNVQEFATRLGQLGALAPTAAQAIGLGASFDELGIKTRTAASAIKMVMVTATKSPEKMGMFADQIGRSSEELQRMMDTDPNKFLITLAKSFKGASDTEIVAKMSELGLTSAETVSVMSMLSKNLGVVEKHQNNATKAFKEGTSVNNEFAKRNETLAASLDKFKNSVIDLTVRIGESIGTAIKPFIDGFKNIIKGVTAFLATKTGKIFLTITTAIVGTVAAVVMLNKIVLASKTIFMLLARTVKKTTLAFSPFTLIAVAIAGIASLAGSATKAFAEFNGEVKTGLGGFLQRLGGVIAGVKAIIGSWDSVNKRFSLSGDLLDKLTQLGIKDTVLAIGTLAIRFMEFFKGMYDGFYQAFSIVTGFFTMIYDLGISTMEFFGSKVSNSTSKLETWGNVGKVAGSILGGLLIFAIAKFTILNTIALATAIQNFILLKGKIILTSLAMAKNLTFAIVGVIAKLALMGAIALTSVIPPMLAGIATLTTGLFVMGSAALIALLPFLPIIIAVTAGFAAIYYAIDYVIAGFQYLWGWVSSIFDVGANLVGTIWEGMSSLWGSFTGWFSSSWSSVTSWFSGTGNYLYDAGAGVVGGIWNGMESVWSSFTDWFTDAWTSVTDWFSSTWDATFGGGSLSVEEIDKAAEEVYAELGLDMSDAPSVQQAETNGRLERLGDREQTVNSNVSVSGSPVTIELDGDVLGQSMMNFNENQLSRG